MKRTLLVLSALALLAITADTVLTATVASGLQASFANFWLRYTLSLISRTTGVLALATGIVTLVAVAQRHQWGWFAGMFVLLLVSVYGLPLVDVALPYVGLGRVLVPVQVPVFNGVTLAVTPLATLVYGIVGAEAKPPAAE